MANKIPVVLLIAGGMGGLLEHNCPLPSPKTFYVHIFLAAVATARSNQLAILRAPKTISAPSAVSLRAALALHFEIV
jgi:hypothetical protein